MSLSKFLDLLSKKALFLGQLSALRSSDPYEGSLSANRLAYLTRIRVDDDFARQELPSIDGEIHAGVRSAFSPETTYRQNDFSAKRIYVNCWHINEVESANLWQVYTNQGEGVAIQSTIGSLVTSLGSLSKEVTIAPVRYIDYGTFNMSPSYEEAAFYKRISFKSERELRIRYLLPFDKGFEEIGGQKYWNPPTGVHLAVDCNKLIERIYISPTLGQWFSETVENVVQKMGIDSPVIKSSISSPRIL